MEISRLLRGFAKDTWTVALGLVGLGVDVQLDLSDAPGGDLNLDEIFGESPRTQTTVESKPDEQSTTTQTTTTDEPVIKTKTGTVYKSIDDAVQGIEHKDALIAQLRTELQSKTGQDPLVQRKPAEPTGPKSYLEDQDAYFADIADAVQSKNTKKYMEAQQKLVWDSLGPIAPTITALSKANAEQVVSSQYPEFKGFTRSEAYSQTLQEAPLLAEAIRSAELNPAAASQLPELYKLAYLANQGRRVPELIQSVEAHKVAAPVPRPTVHSTPVPPPAQQGGPQAQPSLNTAEGRKALIAAMEGRGVGDLKF